MKNTKFNKHLSLLGRRRPRSFYGFLFALPAFIFFFIFSVYPMLNTFFISFFRYDLLTPKAFIGLSNFKTLVHEQAFWQSLRFTLFYVFGATVPVWIISMALAIFFNRKFKFRQFFRTGYFAPVVLSWVVVSVIWKLLYHEMGIINRWLIEPLFGTSINWLTSVRYAPIALIIVAIWKEIGYFMVLFLAGLHTIPRSYYEAAQIDGARKWDQFRYITLPILKPTTLFVVIISLIRALKRFIPHYVMTGGGPAGSTKIISFLIYENGFVFLKMGKAAAISIVMFFFIMIFTLFQLKLFGDKTR